MALSIHYDPEADAVFLRLTEARILESEETSPGVIIDFDSDGKIVALEFLNARKTFSAEAIEEFSKAA